MDTLAVVLERPEKLALNRLDLTPPGDDDVVVDIEWSGISTGTERLLWTGRMPQFPGMGYPLVPGYESVGRVRSAGPKAQLRVGERVFVPGARCYGEVRGLFGGASQRVVVPGSRVIPIAEHLGEHGVLLALAATAYHAMHAKGARTPDLIIGHGVLGRLLARLALLEDGDRPDRVGTQSRPRRRRARLPRARPGLRRPARLSRDLRRQRRRVAASTASSRVSRPAANWCSRASTRDPLAFAFAPAFMREARIRVAAQWQESDLVAVKELAESGRLSLAGLITHREDAEAAPAAYRTAFSDPACLKMVLDWRACA